jgi:hypothetical protein
MGNRTRGCAKRHLAGADDSAASRRTAPQTRERHAPRVDRMDLLDPARNPLWRHGQRVAACARPRGVAPRRRGAAAMGAVRGAARVHLAPAVRCRSLPRLAFGPA